MNFPPRETLTIERALNNQLILEAGWVELACCLLACCCWWYRSKILSTWFISLVTLFFAYETLSECIRRHHRNASKSKAITSNIARSRISISNEIKWDESYAFFIVHNALASASTSTLCAHHNAPQLCKKQKGKRSPSIFQFSSLIIESFLIHIGQLKGRESSTLHYGAGSLKRQQ